MAGRRKFYVFFLAMGGFVLMGLFFGPSRLPAFSQVDHLPSSGLGSTEPTKAEVSSPLDAEVNIAVDNGKWFFQDDLEYANPKFDIPKLKTYAPHNYKGPGHPTFATYLATRNSSVHDPYFSAAQQMAYRLLWDPRSKSDKHPLTVFVAPFIPQEQRDLLTAAGAIVREIGLIPFRASGPALFGRWRDMFSKLNMWNETEYSRIAFFDVDAFALKNLDGIFDLGPERTCKKDILPQEDKTRASEICDYVFAGAGMQENDEINAGVLVFKPCEAMHARLLRESQNTENYNGSMVEQAFLNYAFGRNSPFPATWFDKTWNGFFAEPEDEGKLKVLHEKLWALSFFPSHFAADYFNSTWNDMLGLYQSKDFALMRAADGLK